MARAGEWLGSFEPDEAAFEGFIVSCVSGMDAPVKPYALTKRRNTTYLAGLDPHAREERRAQMLAATPGELRSLGAYIRSYAAFPKGANVTFRKRLGRDHVKAVTYERGVEDFTLACGTGTGAVVTVLTLLGKVSGRNVRVRMDGGELAVDAEAHDGRIENLYLTGPAVLVCAGEILDKTILDLIKKQEEKA